ncbi:hypothetical protein [Acinetobacter lwoffii]|uniref:hypothetical protein n=1 Tax=Acinetobacter lwoffii TaxID=28090 RepID=UPI00209A8BDD|nr:hypothetical protein [Acinetobacter lwoffii]MCO8079942.1 hypothetical protein [Acinetobacter lwoffii]MCO8094184.1 hypothetical protein [Acinetobacter lwoffii]
MAELQIKSTRLSRKNNGSFCIVQAKKALQGIEVSFALHFFAKMMGFVTVLERTA